ncbi:MAG: preprotein translocase subunit SecY [Gammaproteobacteria bacterium]|nr:preprotein translocase subunit SecY [Gammaproteobacteria bacterium]NNC96580.1 preprotein translocase subunit SecY [Gammaproteobacteria bacterium]
MTGSRLKELRGRIFFLLGALLVYRIGTFIPVPGVDPQRFRELLDLGSGQGGIFEVMNMFSGGALERLSIFALGIMPYITTAIVVQMLTAMVPRFMELKKEGQAGQRKLTTYTRYGTLGLASVQAFFTSIALQNQGIAMNPGPQFMVIAVVSLVTGALFLMWLGEQITERGIGNGISLLILASIVAGLPGAFGNSVTLVNNGQLSSIAALLIFLGVLVVIYGVCYFERALRKIAVNYAKRMQGRRMMAGQSSHLPFKVNMSGVMAPIFASSLILLPVTIASFAGTSSSFSWLQDISDKISPGKPLYIMLYTAMIVGFCFFWVALVQKPEEIADNLKRSGAFIPGIRPGKQTGEYIDKVLTRLTFWAAIYVTIVCLIPEFLILKFNVPFYFGGTSLLIIVVVFMDFMSQLQAHAMSHQYEGLMKKSNFTGKKKGKNKGK